MSSPAESLPTMLSPLPDLLPEVGSVASGEDSEFSEAFRAKYTSRPPAEWKPFLDSFPQSTKLPIEIRQAIWKRSLDPRVIELKYNSNHGFYASTRVREALKVCSDSRKAVLPFYQLCFGNVLQEPAVVINFKLDTIYFDSDFGPHVVPFLMSLKVYEATQITSIAIDRYVDEYREYIDAPDYDNFAAIKQAMRVMPAMKEVNIVYKLDEMWHDHGLPQGRGSIELFDTYPWEMQCFINIAVHLDDEDGASECLDMPNSDGVLEDFQVPLKGSLWGWRRTKLPEDYPWM